jgi:uncharacterized membrane protein
VSAGPSGWSRRALIVSLAIVGLVVSLYLACFQLGIVTVVWDPIFGSSSSEAVLASSFSRALPVPDALLGAGAYLIEIVLDTVGGERRYRTRPWLVLLFGLVAFGAAGVSVLLVALQAFVFHAFCTLCLLSAAVSWLILLLAFGEIRAAVGEVRARHRAGASWRSAVLNRPRVHS